MAPCSPDVDAVHWLSVLSRDADARRGEIGVDVGWHDAYNPDQRLHLLHPSLKPVKRTISIGTDNKKAKGIQTGFAVSLPAVAKIWFLATPCFTWELSVANLRDYKKWQQSFYCGSRKMAESVGAWRRSWFYFVWHVYRHGHLQQSKQKKNIQSCVMGHRKRLLPAPSYKFVLSNNFCFPWNLYHTKQLKNDKPHQHLRAQILQKRTFLWKIYT